MIALDDIIPYSYEIYIVVMIYLKIMIQSTRSGIDLTLEKQVTS